MLIIMQTQSQSIEQQRVVHKIEELGYQAHVLPGPSRLAIGITGNSEPVDERPFLALPGVVECLHVTKPNKLVSREFQPENTRFRVGDHEIGGDQRTVIAGPCAVESEEQVLRIARKVKASGAHLLRGGAFKPRTSPYSFQGLGREGLQILRNVSQEVELPVISEAIDLKSLELVAEYADVIQIGARNMQNFALLREVGLLRKPVMLKRGPSATVEEVLGSAEYILQNGNQKVILCERGLRSFDRSTRNLLDISFVPVMQELTHLPVFVDPSHAAGRRDIVPALTKAALMVGASGVMLEVHDRPEEALSDGAQSLLPGQFDQLMGETRFLLAQ